MSRTLTGKHLKFEFINDWDCSQILTECFNLQLEHFRDEKCNLPAGRCLKFKRMVIQPIDDTYWEMYWEAEKRSVVPGDYEWLK